MRIPLLLLVPAALATLVAPLQAHPVHASLSMVEWNAETKKLEVALRADPVDLERILSRLHKSKVDLETKAADKLILAYLKKSFVIQSADGGVSPLQWVGKEISPKAAWLYFEVPLKGEVATAKFSVRVFFELEKDQTHVLNLKVDKARRTLRFKSK